MKLFVKHDLPRRLRSAQLYVEFLNASLYLSVDGSKASVMGSIGVQQGRPVAITDREGTPGLQGLHDVVGVVDQDDDRVVLKTAERQRGGVAPTAVGAQWRQAWQGSPRPSAHPPPTARHFPVNASRPVDARGSSHLKSSSARLEPGSSRLHPSRS